MKPKYLSFAEVVVEPGDPKGFVANYCGAKYFHNKIVEM
jgi:hypothetical protein